ncbi:phage adaptor protein [Stappia indica]|uniref:phage adaptor protein n=1 Tax=Stappia indica TaxID=538381 RepID=UPI001CD1B2E8|nr:hypothetical protein [Stappia indica]MCA1298035.1 hypothetical protein [Stappia indica]
MTTLSTLKTRIAADLDDTSGAYGDDIADAISRAIEFYQPVRFGFNETRDETFTTVAGQQIYSSEDDTAIPAFYRLDLVTVTVAGQVRRLDRVDPGELELLSDSSASTGDPYAYAYFDNSLRLYPIPGAGYTIRMVGHIKKAAPASDEEAGNVWMTEAYQLIRCAAKKYLAENVTEDAQLQARMERAEERELGRLVKQSGARIGSGMIVPTQF